MKRVKTTRIWTVKVRLLQDIENPVLDFIRILTCLGDQYNYWDATVVCFSGKDTTGKEFYVNRFEGKPLFLKECRDPERMDNIIYIVCIDSEFKPVLKI